MSQVLYLVHKDVFTIVVPGEDRELLMKNIDVAHTS